MVGRQRNTGSRNIYPRFSPVGDGALSAEFGDIIDPGINAQVRALDRSVAASDIPGIIETVPSFRALLIFYEPEEIAPHDLIAGLRRLIDSGLNVRAVTGRSWMVPVAYGFPDDGDLHEVARTTGLSLDDVVAVHGSGAYQVYMMGFVPGLAMLGGLPAPLHISRRAEPRQGIAEGSVMIGGMQSLIVPMTMPSGWYTLGRTPLRLFNPAAANPFLFRLGDQVRFRPITVHEMDGLAKMPNEYFLDPPE
jgi:KipI family sensor histidine kinase inhibitor